MRRISYFDTEMKILAVITEHEPIHKILDHLKSKKIDPGAKPFTEQATISSSVETAVSTSA